VYDVKSECVHVAERQESEMNVPLDVVRLVDGIYSLQLRCHVEMCGLDAFTQASLQCQRDSGKRLMSDLRYRTNST